MARTVNPDLPTVHAVLPDDLKQQVMSAAAEDCRTISSWVTQAVREKLKRDAALRITMDRLAP
jgi:hypothetical protein